MFQIIITEGRNNAICRPMRAARSSAESSADFQQIGNRDRRLIYELILNPKTILSDTKFS